MADQMPEVDQLIYESRNLGKNGRRASKILTFLVLMCVFVSSELIINGKCLLNRDKLIFFAIDCLMYLGVFLISINEIRIQIKKRKKKFKMQIRLRVLMCKYIRTYLCFVCIILLLCIIHLGVQIYFFSFEFDQECFYLIDSFNGDDKKGLKNFITFTNFKITLFIVFVIIEIIIIFFLIWVLKQNYKAVQNRYKFRRSRLEFQSYGNDIVLKINSETPQHSILD